MADWNWDRFGDDDDEEEDGGDFKRQWGSKDGLIFMIDCTKGMFVNSEEENTSAFELCIKCAKSVIQNKIISSDKDLMGIVFFGTDKAKNPSEFKRVYILHELDLPGADKVLELEDLLEPGNNDFKKKFGHSDGYSLSDALWTCSNMFSNCPQKLGYKRVMLFTNNDNPHGNSAQLRRQAAAKAEDLHQNGVDIQLMHMNRSDRDFDVQTFYKDILFTDDDENTILPDPSEKFDELLTRVRSKDHKKRAMGRVSFSMGHGLDFSVGIYNLVRTCHKPAAVKLYKKTNEEIKSVTKTFLAETGEILMPQDIKKSQTYATRKICFEQEEVAEIKRFDTPGLKLMGFKPKKSLENCFHVRPAQFLYPDETTFQGSSTVFTALLKRCLDREVVPICRYIPRRNTPPRFVALVPQAEQLDDHNLQTAPPGFHVIFLPFADDFRNIKFDETLPRANQDQVNKAKEVINKLTFKKFSCDNFENPALQTHYANVEAMALDRDKPDEITDYTQPNVEQMDKKASREIEEFKDLVFPEGYVPGAKRKATGGAGAAAKKAKTDGVDIDVEAEARAGRIAKLTVPILKEYIKQAKIKTSSTKKADLIDAIAAHLGL